MLVLSAAVLVIVIDARDVGRWGWRAGVVDHDRHEFHEKGFGHTRTQRSGARSTLTALGTEHIEKALGTEHMGLGDREGLGDRAYVGLGGLGDWALGALGPALGTEHIEKALGPWGQSIWALGTIWALGALGTEHKS